jgi:hypothetical protein
VAELTPLEKRKIQERGAWNWNAFMKVGEYKFGDFKFVVLNLSASDFGAINTVSDIGNL